MKTTTLAAPIDRSMAVFHFSHPFLFLTVLEHLEQRQRRDVDLLGGVHLRHVPSGPGGAAAGLLHQALEAVHEFFFRSKRV